MKIIIHRGSDEIGGSCVELAYEGASILLDLGAPLNDEAEGSLLRAFTRGHPECEQKALFKAVIPPTVDIKRIRAVIVSHSHHDHVGLVDLLPSDVPVYVGAGAERIMRAAALWIPGSVRLNNSAVYQPDEPFQVAGFTVTPYSVDHSAFDSYALLVKAGDKKVFYSGDFRNSGYASYKTKKLLKNPPKDVDALLMEGTTIGSDTHGNVPEESLTNRICNAVKDDTGLVFLAASSQNIDRLVTAIKAANRLNRRLVIDNYAYSVLMATGIKSITGALSRVKVFIHRRQRLKIMRDNLFAERPPGRMRLFEDDLVAEQEKYILLYRFAHIETFKYAKLKNPLLIYSMWNGYFDRDEAIKKFIAAKGIRLEHIHTSGHADIKTLQSLAKAVKPKILIPVHTENPGKYTELFDNVKITKELEL